MSLKTVGLLSPGQMGSAVARVLIEHNLNVITCLAGRSPQTAERSGEVGIRAVPELSSLIRESDLLLSILVPSEALSIAEDVARFAADMDRRVTYVDCNAIAPATAEAIGSKITGVDVFIFTFTRPLILKTCPAGIKIFFFSDFTSVT